MKKRKRRIVAFFIGFCLLLCGAGSIQIQMRKDINDWIKSADNPADGWIDLDFMCTDDSAVELKSEYTTDGARFTSPGQQTLVDAVPLEYFQ